MEAEQLLSGALDLAALVREVRAGLLWQWFLFGFLAGVVAALLILTARRCSQCGR